MEDGGATCRVAVRPTLRRDIYPIVIRAKLMKPDLIGGYRHKSARHRGG